MNTCHRIHKMTADIHFERPMDAVSLQEHLPVLIRQGLASVMEEVFDTLCPGREKIHIRKLTLDLGDINLKNFDREMGSKLKSCLLDALGREIHGQTPPLFSFDSLADKLIQIISTGSHQNIDPYWIPLITTHGRATKALLLKKGKTPLVRKHIAWLFPRERLKELILLFEPFHHGFIDYFVDRPERLMTWETLRTATPAVFKKQVAEFILAYLFVERGSRFNKKLFLSSVIQQISGHYNIKYTALLFSLVHVFESAEDESPLRKEILAFLLELELAKGARQEDPVDKRERALVFDYLLNKTGPFEKKSAQILERLIKSDPRSIALFLAQHRDISGLFKKMVRILDPHLLGRILNIQHPGRHLTMAKYTVILNQAYYSRLFAGSEKMAHFLLWEAVLQFDPPFEEQKFCRHLLTQMAQNSTVSGSRGRFLNRFVIRLVLDLRKNREHYALLKAVLALKGIKEGLELLGEKGFENLDNAVFFLRFYLEKAGNRRKIAVSFPRDRIASLIRLIQPVQYEFIDAVIKESLSFFKQTTALDQGETNLVRRVNEFVLDFLVHDRAAGFNRKNFVAGIVGQMAFHTGMKYERQVGFFKIFVGKNQAQTPLKRQLSQALFLLEKELALDGKIRESKETPKELVMAYLTQILPAEGNETSYLINAVKKFEAKAVNKTDYYAAILEKLLENRTIDFDRILTEKAPKIPGDKTDTSKLSLEGKITALVTSQPNLLHGFIEKHLHRPDFIRLLTTSLSLPLLNRILYLLRPRDFVSITRYTQILKKSIANAWGLSFGRKMEIHLWQAVFMGIREKHLSRSFDEAIFIPRFLAHMAQIIPKYSRKTFYARVEKELAEHSSPPSAKAEHLGALSILSCLAKTSSHKTYPPPKEPPPSPPPAKQDNKENIMETHIMETHIMETLYPDNCGLVLAAPYLPRLFTSLGLMENLKFKDGPAAIRGVRLLQYMVDQTSDTPWALLAFNRLLCNVGPRAPANPNFEITPREKETIESLILGMIQNWKAIGNTSIQGFRESFLARKGVLTLDQNNCWHLKVEPKTFDMLLDSLSWSFSTIKHPWMDRVIHVKWR
jgi:Contractile injection system tape measure protein